jgi:hypothetical protein
VGDPQRHLAGGQVVGHSQGLAVLARWRDVGREAVPLILEPWAAIVEAREEELFDHRVPGEQPDPESRETVWPLDTTYSIELGALVGGFRGRRVEERDVLLRDAQVLRAREAVGGSRRASSRRAG